MNRYQILLSANCADGLVQTLKKTILVRFQELGIDSDAIQFYDDSTISSRDRKSPIVGVFLSTEANPPSRTSITELVQDGLMVVPVVKSRDHFNDFVFDELRGIVLVQREMESRRAPLASITPFLADQFAGIRCVPMPGHTPGHQSIHVATQSGTAIICGAAAMNVSVNVDRQIPPGFLDNMSDTMSGLRKLKREGKHVLPTHDPEVFTKYPNGTT